MAAAEPLHHDVDCVHLRSLSPAGDNACSRISTGEREDTSAVSSHLSSIALSTCTQPRAVRMPRVALGTFRLAEVDAQNAVRRAIAHGVTHIDTATVYRNEQDVSIGLQDAGAAGAACFVTSKVSPRELGRDKTIAALEAMQSRFGESRSVDCVLLHWPAAAKVKSGHAALRAASWRVLEDAFFEGKLAAIGVSNFEERHIDALVRDGARVMPMVNQIELHPLLAQKSLRAYCRDKGIAVSAYSPFGTGALLRDERICAAASRCGNSISAAQMLVLWSLMRCDCVVAKASSDAHVAELAAAWTMYQQHMARKSRSNNYSDGGDLGENDDEDAMLLPHDVIASLDAMDEGKHFCWDPARVEG